MVRAVAVRAGAKAAAYREVLSGDAHAAHQVEGRRLANVGHADEACEQSVTGGCSASMGPGGVWPGVGPSAVARLSVECVAVAAHGGGPALAEGLSLSHGQPRGTAALPAFTLFEGRPSSARFSGSCQSERWDVLSRDSERREEICTGAPQPSSAALCEFTCRSEKGAPLQGLVRWRVVCAAAVGASGRDVVGLTM